MLAYLNPTSSIISGGSSQEHRAPLASSAVGHELLLAFSDAPRLLHVVAGCPRRQDLVGDQILGRAGGNTLGIQMFRGFRFFSVEMSKVISLQKFTILVG